MKELIIPSDNEVVLLFIFFNLTKESNKNFEINKIF